MKTPIKIAIGIVAILLAVTVTVIALLPRDSGVKKVLRGEDVTYNPTTTAARVPSGTTAVPAVTTTTTTFPTSTPIGGEATLPTQIDPDTGKTEVNFPCTIQPYGLVVEKLAPYTGKYVEDGSNVTLQNVAMLLVHNQSGHPIEYATLTVEYEGMTLLFDLSALPAGGRAVVQEKMRRSIPSEGDPTACKALVVQRADMGFSEDQVLVTENEDGSLTVKNLTKETIPSIRVFYKYYLEKEGIYVGGIAFTSNITGLRPGSSQTIRPSHYEKGSSRIVRVSAYETDTSEETE